MIYNDDSSTKKGRLLGRGKGMDNMMAKSFINKWSDENTILEVKNPNDLNSSWSIYERVKK